MKNWTDQSQTGARKGGVASATIPSARLGSGLIDGPFGQLEYVKNLDLLEELRGYP